MGRTPLDRTKPPPPCKCNAWRVWAPCSTSPDGVKPYCPACDKRRAHRRYERRRWNS